MAELSLSGGLFAELTAAGAYYAMTTPATSREHLPFLWNVMREGSTTFFSEAAAQRWTDTPDPKTALEQVWRWQRMGLIRGTSEPMAPETLGMDDVLPALLVRLSSTSKGLIASANGMVMSSVGYRHETAEELAGFAVTFMACQEKAHRLLRNNLRIHTEGLGLIDAAGESDLGFWPMYIMDERWVLTLAGEPRLQDRALLRMVMALDLRYGTPHST